MVESGDVPPNRLDAVAKDYPWLDIIEVSCFILPRLIPEISVYEKSAFRKNEGGLLRWRSLHAFQNKCY